MLVQRRGSDLSRILEAGIGTLRMSFRRDEHTMTDLAQMTIVVDEQRSTKVDGDDFATIAGLSQMRGR